MAVNSELLERSIQQCYSDFLDYLALINRFGRLSLQFWEGKADWESLSQVEADSNFRHCKNLLDIEWHCTKNAPSATKLRFFLALLLSSKDLERCGDYLYSISKIALQDKNKTIKNIVLSSGLWELTLQYFQNIYSLFRNSTGKIQQLIFEEILSEKSTLHSKLTSLSIQLNQELLNKKGLSLLNELQQSSAPVPFKLKEVEELLFSSRLLQLVLVKIDRFLDHSFNIVENFYYIKNQESRLDYNSLSREKHAL